MRRISALLMFMAVIVLTAPMALAQGGAVYVAPKVGFSIQNIDSQGYDLNKYWPDYRKFMDGDEDKTVFTGGLAVGYDFGIQNYAPIRLELEYLARTEAKAGFSDNMHGLNARGDIKLWTQTIFANAYYDIETETPWTPYFGFGLGWSHFDARANTRLAGNAPWSGTGINQKYTDRNSAWNFAWNLGGGVSYPIETGIDLDIGYRYNDFGDVTLKVVEPQSGAILKNKVESSAHEILFGLRFTGF